MASSARGTTVPAGTVTGSTWANATAAALCDGTVGVYDTATCTFTNAAASGTGAVPITGYVFASNGSASITACTAVVNCFVSATAHITSILAQLQTSAGVAIGAAQNVTLNTTATSVTVTPNVLPTVAQCAAGLQMKVTCLNGTGTTSSSCELAPNR
jgi:hypothetical protein